MVKITIEDLVAAGEVVGGRAFDDLLGRFVDEQAEILDKGERDRMLRVNEHHTLTQARRKLMQTEEFKKDMRRRNGIESTQSELVRGYGLRRARYRGNKKTRLQNYFIGAACNIKRWCRRVTWEAQQAAAGIGSIAPIAVPA
ncbi:MAG: hypothetical protein A2X28_06305 [Elusimicrobia bacterium GWA2_56_46]|nr:MAG: hypothetical protein A2X28_06305 [Elusimicrobia bacterium GWA2_56_46]OGR54933.1 MAG: hypothetical protein A2X39_11685 [Elusimicrobia bacterium GWC2_56_31]HBW23269.1 hypothetical protein [Elusimicrobiota bacterium]